MSKFNLTTHNEKNNPKYNLLKLSNKRKIDAFRLKNIDKENIEPDSNISSENSPAKPKLKKLKVLNSSYSLPSSPVALNSTVIVNSGKEEELSLLNLIRSLQAQNDSFKAELLKKEVDNLNLQAVLCDEKIKNEELTQKLNLSQASVRQVSIPRITSLLEKTFSVKKTDKALTEIQINNDEWKIVTVGRPPIYGESKAQFSHIIPYGLLKKMLQRLVSSKLTIKEKIEVLIEDVLVFFKYDEGICISTNELAKFNLSSKKAASKASLIIKTNKNTHYLIDNNFEKIIEDSSDYENAKLKYSEKKQKFIKSVLNNLNDSISDVNTAQIFCNEFANFMFVLFNKKTFAAYPKEGNICESEIRLYDSRDSALSHNKDYEIITVRELDKLLERKAGLSNKIRFVNNSGSKVKEALKALAVLDEIFEIFFKCLDPQEKIAEYNSKYNSILKLSNSNDNVKNYNSELSQENIKSSIYLHIAKQAYIMFGLKALEDQLLVPSKSTKNIKIFDSATGKKCSYYKVVDGESYRKSQRADAKKKYTKDVIFRSEKTDLDFLAKKITEFICILKLTFESFSTGFLTLEVEESCPQLILKELTKLISLDYNISYDKFYNNRVSQVAKFYIDEWNLDDLSDVELSAEYRDLFDNDY